MGEPYNGCISNADREPRGEGAAMKQLRWLLFVLLAVAALLAVARDNPSQAQAVFSVDAILVFEDHLSADIHYSFRGHDPDPPVEGQPLDVAWWSIPGGPASPTAPIATVNGFDLRPDVAYGPLDTTFAVWGNMEQVDAVDCFGFPEPRFEGDIIYSRF